MEPLRVLMIEDVEADALLIARELERSGFGVASTRVESRVALEAALDSDWDLIVVDYSLPQFSGLSALALLAERAIDTPAIVISGTVDELSAVEAMRAGARDFVTKQKLARLGAVVRRELDDVERRRAQRRDREALHEAEAKLGLIADQLPAVIWTTGTDLRLTSVLGLDGELEGASVSDVMGADGEAPRAHRDALEGRTTIFDLEWNGCIRRSDVRPLRNLAGEVIGCIGVAIDVTEERRAEVELRRSEARFRALIENALDVVSIVDAQGRISYAAPSFEQALGYAADEAVGLDAFDLVHPDDQERVWQMFHQGIESAGSSAITQYRVRHKNGSWRTLDTVGHNLLGDPAVGGVVITSRDVTERNHLAEQLQQARRLEAIGQLAGGIAHDFNNVLMVVSGYAAILQQSLDGTREADSVRQILDAADRGAALTRQLLAYGRRQSLDPTVFDLNEVVGAIQALLRRLLPEDVQLTVRPSEHPAFVRADPGQLEQVLANLVTNARDAMPSGGEITIALGAVELDGTDGTANGSEPPLSPGRYVTARIEDTGSGIAAESLGHIFEPFYTTKPQGQGTGLGLATVYGIVAQSGGGVSVETEVAKGSTFTVFLPAVDEAPARSAVAVDETPAHGKETILLVEDDDQVRDLTATILREHGYTVLTADRPSRAREVSDSHPDPIDVLVSDVVMPETSGFTLARELLERRPHLARVFISGYPDRIRVDTGSGGAASAPLLHKPFTAAELTRAVRRAIDTNKSLRERSDR